MPVLLGSLSDRSTKGVRAICSKFHYSPGNFLSNFLSNFLASLHKNTSAYFSAAVLLSRFLLEHTSNHVKNVWIELWFEIDWISFCSTAPVEHSARHRIFYRCHHGYIFKKLFEVLINSHLDNSVYDFSAGNAWVRVGASATVPPWVISTHFFLNTPQRVMSFY